MCMSMCIDVRLDMCKGVCLSDFGRPEPEMSCTVRTPRCECIGSLVEHRYDALTSGNACTHACVTPSAPHAHACVHARPCDTFGSVVRARMHACVHVDALMPLATCPAQRPAAYGTSSFQNSTFRARRTCVPPSVPRLIIAKPVVPHQQQCAIAPTRNARAHARTHTRTHVFAMSKVFSEKTDWAWPSNCMSN